MNYRIYTRDNPYGGVYIILEVDKEKKLEKYCGTQFGGRWYAYWLNAKVKTGKFQFSDNLYEGKI